MYLFSRTDSVLAINPIIWRITSCFEQRFNAKVRLKAFTKFPFSIYVCQVLSSADRMVTFVTLYEEW